MITFEQAREIILQRTSQNSGLDEESTLEKPYGWYFRTQSKKWLETRNDMDLLVGINGFIVERDSGRVIEIGSATTVESAFEHFEAGLSHEFYILTIENIRDVKNTFIALQHLRLIDLRLQYESKPLNFFVSPTQKGEEFYQKILQSLPFTFPVQHFYFQHNLLLTIKQKKWFEYSLIGVAREDLIELPEPIYGGLLPFFDFDAQD
jgi:hypothetical protein